MPSSIWQKYTKITELNDNKSDFKNILSEMKVIIKEIIPKDNNECILIRDILENLKNTNYITIYDIIEESDKIYVVIDNDEEVSIQLDSIINQNKEIKKEGNTLGRELPITKKEIFNLFKMENAVCRIHFENEVHIQSVATGFFCEIEALDIPIKLALFTNYHVLNENNIEKSIKFDIISKSYNNNFNIYNTKEIKVNVGRKIIYSKTYDYTCIELFKSDGITNFFRIDYNFLGDDKRKFLNTEIFLLQYPETDELSFSVGKIISINDKKNNINNDTNEFKNRYLIVHNASTKLGSSGSPIIKRNEDNNTIIGLHFGAFYNNEIGNNNRMNNYKFNIANFFDIILFDMDKQIKEKYQNTGKFLHHNLNFTQLKEQDKLFNTMSNKEIIIEPYLLKSQAFDNNKFKYIKPEYHINEININDNKKETKQKSIKENNTKNLQNYEKKYNNLIFYNEAQNNVDLLYKESIYFEKKSNEAFILCTNIQSLSLISKEILKKNKDNNKIKFNLILGEISSNFRKFFNENNDFKKCILKVSNYSIINNLEDCFPQLDIINGNTKEDIINFIEINSSQDIQPFPTTFIKTYKDYINQYKDMHSRISFFYNDLTFDSFIQNFVKIKKLLDEDRDGQLKKYK